MFFSWLVFTEESIGKKKKVVSWLWRKTEVPANSDYFTNWQVDMRLRQRKGFSDFITHISFRNNLHRGWGYTITLITAQTLSIGIFIMSSAEKRGSGCEGGAGETGDKQRYWVGGSMCNEKSHNSIFVEVSWREGNLKGPTNVSYALVILRQLRFALWLEPGHPSMTPLAWKRVIVANVTSAGPIWVRYCILLQLLYRRGLVLDSTLMYISP